MKYLVCTVIVLLAYIVGFAQKNYLPGYVILNNGSKIFGFTNYRNWEKNPTSFQFKTSLSETAITYDIKDIQAFQVDGFDKYERAVVSINMMPLIKVEDIKDNQENQKDTSKIDTVFLREIIKREPISIYEYVDFKNHFYYRNKLGLLEELIYKTYYPAKDSTKSYDYRASENFIVTDYGFRYQLRSLLPLEIDKKKSNMLMGLSYAEDDLKKFALLVNTSDKTETINNFNNPKAITFFAGGGLAFQTMTFKGDYYYLNKLTFSSSITPTFIAGAEVSIGRNLQKVLVRLDVSYSNLKTTGIYEKPSGYTSLKQHLEYSIDQSNISPSLSMLYSFINFPKAKIYAGGSFSMNISKYSENKYTTKNLDYNTEYIEYNILDFEKSWVGIHLRGGVIIKKKYELGITALLNGSFMNYITSAEKGQRIYSRLIYRF